MKPQPCNLELKLLDADDVCSCGWTAGKHQHYWWTTHDPATLQPDPEYVRGYADGMAAGIAASVADVDPTDVAAFTAERDALVVGHAVAMFFAGVRVHAAFVSGYHNGYRDCFRDTW